MEETFCETLLSQLLGVCETLQSGTLLRLVTSGSSKSCLSYRNTGTGAMCPRSKPCGLVGKCSRNKSIVLSRICIKIKSYSRSGMPLYSLQDSFEDQILAEHPLGLSFYET